MAAASPTIGQILATKAKAIESKINAEKAKHVTDILYTQLVGFSNEDRNKPLWSFDIDEGGLELMPGTLETYFYGHVGKLIIAWGTKNGVRISFERNAPPYKGQKTRMKLFVTWSS